MSNLNYLFVYGTLLRDHAPREVSGVVRKLKPVGAAKMNGELYDLGEYPGAIAAPGKHSKVSGQVFEILDPALLKELDQYEGYDPARPKRSLFLRKRRFVTLGNGRRLLSWVYIFNGVPKGGQLLDHGNYSRHKSKNGRASSVIGKNNISRRKHNAN